MALDIGGIGSMLIGWLLNPLIWILIIFVFLAVTIGFLKIRKRRKLVYDCLELVDYGKSKYDDYGKFGFNLMKCGWYGKKKLMRGLWDYGEEQLETRDGDIIYEFSTEDFQEINGKRGVICFRDPVNQNILVPIDKCKIKNSHLLGEIAPADFRDVALKIIDDANKETTEWKDKLLQFASWGLVIIFSLVSIIVITQMIKQGQTEAANLITEAGNTCLSNAQTICSQIAAQASSTAP